MCRTSPSCVSIRLVGRGRGGGCIDPAGGLQLRVTANNDTVLTSCGVFWFYLRSAVPIIAAIVVELSRSRAINFISESRFYLFKLMTSCPWVSGSDFQPPGNFQTNWQIFVKLSMYIIELQFSIFNFLSIISAWGRVDVRGRSDSSATTRFWYKILKSCRKKSSKGNFLGKR